MVLPIRQRMRIFIRAGPFEILRNLSNENMLVRILWISSYIISIVLFCYYIYGIFIKWHVDPDISFNIKTVLVHEIPFPAVTYCTPYITSDEIVNFTDFRMRFFLYEKHPEYSQKEQDLLGATLEICAPNLLEGIQKLNNRTTGSILKLINETRSSMELLMGYCGLETYFYDCSKMFNIVPTEKGLCYSFNMQGYNTIFNKGTLTDDFDFYKRTSIAKSLYTKSELYNETVNDDNETIHWTLQDGYLTNRVNSVPYRSSKRALSLYLGFKNLKFFKCFGNSYAVYLHLPSEVPVFNMNPLNAKISTTTQIRIEATSIKRNKNMQKYSPETRHCFFDGEKQLKFFKSFTKYNCELECLANYTLKRCGCARFFMPRSPETRVCDLNDLKCFSDVYRSTYAYKVSNDKIPCNCLPPCNEIKYSIKETSSKPVLDSNPVITAMRNYNISEVTTIDVIFASAEFEELEYFVAYSLQNFIAEAGGLLGLFMGYSFLSIAEFIQKFIKYIHTKRTQNHNVVVAQVRPRNIVNIA